MIALARWAARFAFSVSLLTLAAVPAWWVASRPAPVDAGSLPGSRSQARDTPPAVTTTTAPRTVTTAQVAPTDTGAVTDRAQASRIDTAAVTDRAEVSRIDSAAVTDRAEVSRIDSIPPARPLPDGTTRRASPVAAVEPSDGSDQTGRAGQSGQAGPPTTLAARSGRLADLPAPAPRPVRVTVEQLGVTAEIFHIGVDEVGALNVPENVDHVGWYRGGVRPGQPGSAVLVAHVDSHSQGVGAFYGLADVALGSRVLVEDDRGGHQWWRVDARRDYRKHELPIDTLFRRGGDPVLTLVTCGGEFDPVTRSYDSNVVAYATPLTDRSEGPPVG